MAKYKTHSLFNLFICLPVALYGMVTFLNVDNSYIYTFTASFVYGTLFMSPDMDLAGQIKLLSIRGILSIPFRIYSLFFSHRGISHSLIFGTFTRILWLLAFALIVFYSYFKYLPTKDDYLTFLLAHKAYFGYGFWGLFLADFSHLVLDGEVIK